MASVGSGGSWSATVSQPLTSADLNTWKHVAMTFDGTTLRFYVGGVLIRSAPGAHTTTNVPLLFGRWTPAAEYWNGLIDEVRIYGRGLSQAEIQADMGGAGTAPNVPPTVSLTTPVGGATFTAPSTIAIAATATDSDGTVAKVDFYAGATLVGTDTTSPYAFNWTGVGAGTYVIKAVATDNAGASTTSATRTVTVSVNATVPGAVSGLVGAWVGNEATGTTLTDSSGNGRNGTISGATWVAGRVGAALNFTGSGVADLGDLDLPGAFTVMAWMQTRSLYAGTCGSLVMKAFDYGVEICGGS